MQFHDDRYSEYITEQIKKGTTTCALTCNDGVVLAADTRASAGYFIADRHVMKIQKIDRHLGMTMAGGVADAQNLVDIMRYNSNIYRISNKELIPVRSASRLCANVLFNQRYFPYYVQVILAGFVKDGLSVNEAYKTAIQAIAAAIRRNSGTGDSINVVIIDKDGYRELSKEVKEAVGAVY